ncbi:MAG: CpsB/CapC family capsule biosynthesis tyrosine phosphatase [Ferruginibacter sp.]
MFSFFHKKPPVKKFFPISTDIHSHILPGIDDGSPDVETSIQLVKGLINLGINRSIATPHIIGDMYRNDADSIYGAQQVLQSALEKEGIDFELGTAAEYMLDNYFFEMLDNKTMLLTVHDKLLLTEFSYSAMPSFPEKMSFAIITEGYTPILAHPERYGYYHRDHSFFHRLKDLGFLLQVNILSLTGYYGKEVAAAGRYILQNDLASFVATDLHHQKHLDALIGFSQQKSSFELFGSKKWNEEIVSNQE